jgi:hypothetical protein
MLPCFYSSFFFFHLISFCRQFFQKNVHVTDLQHRISAPVLSADGSKAKSTRVTHKEQLNDYDIKKKVILTPISKE